MVLLSVFAVERAGVRCLRGGCRPHSTTLTAADGGCLDCARLALTGSE